MKVVELPLSWATVCAKSEQLIWAGDQSQRFPQ